MNRLALTLRKAKTGRSMGRLVAAAVCAFGFYGCHQDMWNQPKYTPYQPNPFFADNNSSRQPVDGTVPYEAARRPWVTPMYTKFANGNEQVPMAADLAFWDGRTSDNAYIAENYFPLNDRALYERGRERYNITCAACHGLAGYGDGMIVQRGFPVPPSFHIDRLRQVEDGYIFNVITNGFGRMFSYADRIHPEDRWAIIAYIRALQLSQNVDMSNPDSEFASMVLGGIREQEDAARKAEAEKQEALSHGHGGHGSHGNDDHGAGHGEDHGPDSTPAPHDTTGQSHGAPDTAGDTHHTPEPHPGVVGGDTSGDQLSPGPAGQPHGSDADSALHP